jgi:hypothetical protein
VARNDEITALKEQVAALHFIYVAVSRRSAAIAGSR